MKNRNRWLFALLLLAAIPVVANAQVPDSALPGWLSQFAENVFSQAGQNTVLKNLEHNVANLRTIFVALAFPIVLGGCLARWKRAESTQQMMEAIAKPALLCAFIWWIPSLVTYSLAAGDGIANVSGFSNGDVAGKILQLQNGFALNSSPAAAAAVAHPIEPWYRQIVDGISNLWIAFSNSIRDWGLAVIAFFCCMLNIALLVLYEGASALRLFLMEAGSIMLPIFIAALGTDSFRSPGLRYILGMVGIAMWPVGWLLGNLATVTMVDAFTAALQQICQSALSPVLHGAPMPTQALVLQAMPYLAFSSIGAIVVMLIVVAIWSCVVLFFAPKLISRVIKDGASFFEPLMGMQAGAALGVGAGIASLAGAALSAGVAVAPGAAAAAAKTSGVADAGGATRASSATGRRATAPAWARASQAVLNGASTLMEAGAKAASSYADGERTPNVAGWARARQETLTRMSRTTATRRPPAWQKPQPK